MYGASLGLLVLLEASDLQERQRVFERSENLIEMNDKKDDEFSVIIGHVWSKKKKKRKEKEKEKRKETNQSLSLGFDTAS